MQADLLILMSDVDGIYTCPPSEEGARLINTYSPNHAVTIQYGKKSRVGLGGMDSKVSFNYFPLIQIRIQFRFKKNKFNLNSTGSIGLLGIGKRNLCRHL